MLASSGKLYMTSSILLVTVGGSHQPIATAIRSLEPDRVLFICSDGSKGSQSQVLGTGKPCEVRRGTEVVEKLPNIPTQVGLGDRFNPAQDVVLLQDPDDLSQCYQAISAKIRGLKVEMPGAKLFADYTGGTKTMSLAMGLAALDYDIRLYLTTGATRLNLIRIEQGEATGRASTASVTVERQLQQVLPKFFQQYNYSAAIAELQYLLNEVALSNEEQQRVRRLQALSKGLDAWDRFDHNAAWMLLKPYMKDFQALGQFLKRVLSSRAAIDETFGPTEGTTGHGFEVVEDLLLNAERRAHRCRYDDAVGRLYRALELLVQMRLKLKYGIKTEDIDRSLLPAKVAQHYEKIQEKLKMSLQQSYDLLSKFDDDLLGNLYDKQKSLLLNTLKIRNKSLYAHGFEPISANEFAEVDRVMGGFIRKGIQVCIEPRFQKVFSVQFPTRFDK
jgi:CRISPR-associated protein (TIGR02710 family)